MMIRRLRPPLALAVFALAALSACRGMTPEESTRAAATETRELITRHVADAGRAKQLIVLVDALESRTPSCYITERTRNRIDCDCSSRNE